METNKLVKLIGIIFFAWLFVTYVPNSMLRKWYFILFIFADFYLVAYYLKMRVREDLFLNTMLIGSFILAVVSVILKRMGF
jgi:hypothetical protein